MHLILVTNALKERVAKDLMHDVKERVQHPQLLFIGKRLLNKELKLVLVGRLGVGMRVNTNGRVEPLDVYYTTFFL